jgi:hypothetical protein
VIDTCEVSFGVFVGEGSRENEAGMSPNDIETRLWGSKTVHN